MPGTSSLPISHSICCRRWNTKSATARSVTGSNARWRCGSLMCGWKRRAPAGRDSLNKVGLRLVYESGSFLEPLPRLRFGRLRRPICDGSARSHRRCAAHPLGKDILIVFHGRTSLQAGGARAGREVHWEDADLLGVQAEAPDCEYAIPELEQQDVRAHSSYNNAAFTVTGSHPPFAYIRSLDVGNGRFYNWDDQKEARRVAFLGSDASKQLFPGRNPVGETVYLNAFPYDVIGVMATKKQDSSYDGWDVSKIFIPFAAMRRDFPDKPPGTSTTFDQLLVTPRSVNQHAACKHQIQTVLGRMHNFDPHDKEACPIWDTVQEAKAFQQMTDGMKYFLGAVGIVTLFLGGLGVMNVMMVAVRERTREIGVRKALGAPARTILKQFFFEALLIAFLSGAIGMGIAYGICFLVDLLPMPDFFAGLLATWQSGLVACA